MEHWKTEAIIVAIGMAVLGGQIKQGINKFVEKDRVVTVKGLAEMEVPADKVTWPLVYKEVGNDLITLYDKIKTTNQTIVDFLKGKGIDEEYVECESKKTKGEPEISKADMRILKDIHGMKAEQRKRLMKYMEALKTIEELEEYSGRKDGVDDNR